MTDCADRGENKTSSRRGLSLTLLHIVMDLRERPDTERDVRITTPRTAGCV
jgi:hypothetical protein